MTLTDPQVRAFESQTIDPAQFRRKLSGSLLALATLTKPGPFAARTPECRLRHDAMPEQRGGPDRHGVRSQQRRVPARP